jgi:hypothetical protein
VKNLNNAKNGSLSYLSFKYNHIINAIDGVIDKNNS